MLKTSKLKSLQSLKAVWYQSWTKGWAQVQILGGAALGSISGINSFLQDSTFQSYLGVLAVPKSVYITIAILGIVTLVAHGREDS